jgi:hypothetical protein
MVTAGYRHHGRLLPLLPARGGLRSPIGPARHSGIALRVNQKAHYRGHCRHPPDGACQVPANTPPAQKLGDA